MKFEEAKKQILDGKRVCLVSEENSTFTMTKRKIYFSVEDGNVLWKAIKETHEERPIENSDMLFVSNAKTMKKGSITAEQFKEITAEKFSEVIKEAEEEVVSADGGETCSCKM